MISVTNFIFITRDFHLHLLYTVFLLDSGRVFCGANNPGGSKAAVCGGRGGCGLACMYLNVNQGGSSIKES